MTERNQLNGAAAPPLQGLRVIELGHFVAAPFTSRLLADFGAEVIKVEQPGSGDGLRQWRGMWQGTSLFWDGHARNKKSITLNLHEAEGRAIARRLISQSEVLVENFRPGTLEKWGLDPEVIRKEQPGLVVVRISGFGQTGPYRDQPGWASVGEAMGGLRSVTGYPDRPPVRVGVSLGDSLAGLFGVIGALLALVRKYRSGDGHGDVVDVALYESVFAIMESMLPEYEKLGQVWAPSGSSMPGIAPTNTYPTADDGWVIIGGNSDKIFPVLMRIVGREDLAMDPALANNTGRAAAAGILDEAISVWTRQHLHGEIEHTLRAAGVPVGRVYRAPDILADPNFMARQSLLRLPVQRPSGAGGDGESITVQGVFPKLAHHPGRVEWLGPTLGQHNTEIYTEWLGLSAEELERLREKGIV